MFFDYHLIPFSQNVMDDKKLKGDMGSVLVNFISYKLLGITFDQTSKLRAYASNNCES